MNISMYTTYALNQNFPTPIDAFRHFYDKGIRYADIVDDELSFLPLDLYCKYLQEALIKPNAFVSMLDIVNFNDEKRNTYVATVKRYIEQLEKLKIPFIMLAPDVEPAKNKSELQRMQEYFINELSGITEFAKGSGVKVVIENQSTSTRIDSKIQEILVLLESVPELGFVLDAGNFFCVCEDVLEAYEILKDKLVHVHIKDWKYDESGQYLRENLPRFNGTILGEGLLPLRELIKRINNDGYNGKFNLEINSSKITLDMLDKSADFLRSVLNV